MNIHPEIAKRKSLRAFSQQTVEDHIFYSLFEAARWAPSAFNEQPWRFIAVRKSEGSFKKMADCLANSNRLWAQHAAFLILVVAKKDITRSGAPNRHAAHDTGLAVGNLTVQATVNGIALHQMGGFDMSKASAEFAVPDDFEPITIIAGGYPGNPQMLDDDLRARELAPRVRKPLDELVFADNFGQSHPLFIPSTSSS
ncbi:MAG: nitroreductase family protein [Bacteroidota bacterium]